MESSTHVALTSGIVKRNRDECAARSQTPVGFSSLCKCGHERFQRREGESSDPTQLPLLARAEMVENFLLLVLKQYKALPPTVKPHPH